MNLQILNRNLIPPNIWDSFCLRWGGNLNHLTHFLNYQIVTSDLVEESFGVFLEGDLVAVVPILKHCEKRSSHDSSVSVFVRTPGPLISEPVNRNMFLEYLSNQLKLRVPKGIVYEFGSWKPIKVAPINFPNHLFREQDKSVNLVVDLSMDEELLFKSFSRGHQRTIKKSRSDGQSTIRLDYSSSRKEIESGFNLYRSTHLIAAGKLTRPTESFDLMLNYIYAGIAVLFIGRKNDRKLSFLFCDFVGELSRGWSQANSQELQNREFPRHQTEWEAMLYLKEKGCRYYHLGTFDIKDIGFSAKLDSINHYKKRYHPMLLDGAVKLFGSDTFNV
jgi:hypothetical protein